MIFDLSKVTSHETYNLLIGLVAPRPIAWITSLDRAGNINAAPFSAYNYVGIDPPIVAIGVGNRPGPGVVGKDTAQNIRNTREFVINVVNEELAEAMVTCAIDFPPGVNELEIARRRQCRRPSFRCRESWKPPRAWNAVRSQRWRLGDHE